MKKEILSTQEGKKWQIAFWTLAIGPFFLILLACLYTEALKIVGVCSTVDYWPPPCLMGGVNVTYYVTHIVTLSMYLYLPFEFVALLSLGVVVFIRRSFLKHKSRHQVEVTV